MRKHYPILSVIRTATEERFRAKLAQAGKCLVFTGTKNKAGYGFVQVMIAGKRYPILAHRLAWALHHRKDPPGGLIICHRCNNPACCYPPHLYAGTAADNMRDKFEAGTVVRGKAHPFYGLKGTAHPRSMYDQLTKDYIIRVLSQGWTQCDLASLTSIHPQTLSRWWREYEAACGKRR